MIAGQGLGKRRMAGTEYLVIDSKGLEVVKSLFGLMELGLLFRFEVDIRFLR